MFDMGSITIYILSEDEKVLKSGGRILKSNFSK